MILMAGTETHSWSQVDPSFVAPCAAPSSSHRLQRPLMAFPPGTGNVSLSKLLVVTLLFLLSYLGSSACGAAVSLQSDELLPRQHPHRHRLPSRPSHPSTASTARGTQQQAPKFKHANLNMAPPTAGGKPLCMAHRGQRDEYPENTVLAMEKALEHGADALELDLRLTADHQLVVFHDELLQQASNGTSYIRKRPWFGYVEYVRVKYLRREMSAERVPLFAEVLALVKRDQYAHAKMLLDVKDTNDLVILDLLKETLDLLDDGTFRSRITIGIWDEAFWQRAQELFRSDGYRISLITKSLRLALKEPFLHGVDTFNLLFDLVKANRWGLWDRIRQVANETQSSLYGWTINEESDMRLAKQLGLGAILTDHIRLCRAVVDATTPSAPMYGNHLGDTEEEQLQQNLEDPLEDWGSKEMRQDATLLLQDVMGDAQE